MAKSQLLLNQLRWCFKLHGSIDPMESVKLPSVNYFWKSKMATSEMACLCYIACKHHFVPVVKFYQPLYPKATEIILDPPPCSLFETTALVVGGFHTFVNLLLSDWYTDEWNNWACRQCLIR